MFNNTQISSSWGQPPQNQQQPQQSTSTFGQPAASGFGTGTSMHDQLISRAMQTKSHAGTFGSGGTFGQQPPQQPQQQPQANPMFGGLGGQTNTSTATPGNTGFGAWQIHCMVDTVTHVFSLRCVWTNQPGARKHGDVWFTEASDELRGVWWNSRNVVFWEWNRNLWGWSRYELGEWVVWRAEQQQYEHVWVWGRE